MNKKIANIARMLRTTGNVLNQNKDKWATLAVLATTVPGFLEMVEKIDPAMLESEKEISAPSVDKETIRENLEEERPRRREQVRDGGVAEPVVDVARAPLGRHEAVPSQH